MIKFTAETQAGRTVVGVGLSEGNVRNLKLGLPIHIHFEEFNLPFKIDLMIMYGETEESMTKELQPLIGPNTVTNEGTPS